MRLWSISVAYRLGLGFHALNNEGSEGSNLMQPRRIDVGKTTYDGISGEIVRRHILENFVNICRAEDPPIAVLPASEALHPDRGQLGIRQMAGSSKRLTKLNPAELYLDTGITVRTAPRPDRRKKRRGCPLHRQARLRIRRGLVD